MSRFAASLIAAEELAIRQAEMNADYQGEVAGEPGSQALATAGGGMLTQNMMTFFTPRNLLVFNSLLQALGMGIDILEMNYSDWPQRVKNIWNKYVKGMFADEGFPLEDQVNAVMRMLSPVAEVTEHVTRRAPKGYVVVEYPPRSGRFMGVKREYAREFGWKPAPKAVMTPTDVKAVTRANKALERLQKYATQKNVVEKCMPANTKGIVTRKAKPRRK